MFCFVLFCFFFVVVFFVVVVVFFFFFCFAGKQTENYKKNVVLANIGDNLLDNVSRPLIIMISYIS